MRISFVDIGSYTIGQVLTVTAGYYLFHENGITIGTVAMLVYYMDLLHRPLRQLTEQMEELQRAGGSAASAAWATLFQERSAMYTADRAFAGGPLTVQFQDVCFAYREETILEDLTFDVQTGRVLGLLGRTGSGKTTITRLLARLYDPQRGVVRLAERTCRAWRQRSCAIVSAWSRRTHTC